MNTKDASVQILTIEHFLHELSRVPHAEIRGLAEKIVATPKLLAAVETLQTAFDNPIK